MERRTSISVSRRTPRRDRAGVLRTAALAVFLVLGIAPLGAAQPIEGVSTEHDPCSVADVDESAAADCAAETELPSTANPTAGAAADPDAAKAAGFPASCRNVVEVFAVTINDTLRIAQALARGPSPCAEYYVVVPSPANNRCMPRANAPSPAQIRSLGPRFHAVAEVTLGTATGLVACREMLGITWREIGELYRQRMVTAGYRTDLGDTWLLNEFNEGTRRDRGATNRADMAELVAGLHEGGALPDVAGAAEIGVAYSHQNFPDIPGYREEMKDWLADGSFWAAIDPHVGWTLKEVYADARYQAVPGTSRDERRRHLVPYQQHVLLLANAGPEEASAARAHLRRAYGILLNGAWMAPGGDKQSPPFVSGHGMTQIPGEQMLHFVSEQVYAARHFLNTWGDPSPALGFSWQPTVNATTIPTLNAIAARIASALADTFRQGGGSADGACRPPETDENWCALGVELDPPAAFTDEWDLFRSWD